MNVRTAINDFRVHPALLGMWMFLGTVTMLFAAFTSAYLIRRVSTDWVRIDLPTILWVNTGLLLASSVALEAARSVADRGQDRTASRWLAATAGLGLLFVGGQLIGWRQLVGEGVFIPTSPHSSFFYILTGLHALHLVGGLALLLTTTWRLTKGRRGKRLLLRLSATYWHFMGGLWVFLFLVLARL